MTAEQIVTIVVAILGSSLIQFLISRHDSRKDRLAELDKIQKDVVRLQILFLMHFMPDEPGKILEVSEYYFHKLKGNWYMTDVFTKWLRKNNINIPGWFVIRKEEENYDCEDKGRD